MSNAWSRTTDSLADRFAAAGMTACVVSDSGYEAADWTRAAMSYPVSTEVLRTEARITLSICHQITPQMRMTNTHALNLARGRSAAGWTRRGARRVSGHSA